ncbi:hypothetical protein M413DRAFT_21497 [Hebeloma cylindrosporum]|uniref:Aminoglycoside phosphotransferase domain-containing protein n=1 Tax=Hebeloma cylindrosporum TaxID=76867 RepID=A0A0C3CZG9_HEBCY|nr:hypothetical protein M413DRAFT_21497 [Hebeloma cylindrosporum h7]
MRQLQYSSTRFKSVNDRILILIWTEDSQIFRAEIPDAHLPDADLELSTAVGKRIPENHLFPAWRDTLTEAQQPLSNIYVKKHYAALRAYDDTPFATKFFMAWNLFPRKLIRMSTNILDAAPPLQPDVIISGIKAALDHIHSFGLVHDDIHPDNIMVDDAGNPIIIDFDSCVAVGAPSRGGSLGWSKDPKVAAFENYTYSFELVVKFVPGEYDGMDFDSDFDEDLDTVSPRKTLT